MMLLRILFFTMLSLSGWGQTQLDGCNSGIKHILMHPYVQNAYGLNVPDSELTSCPKMTVLRIEDNISRGIAAVLKRQNVCIKGETIDNIFFYAYEAYFQIVDCTQKKNRYKLKIELITPNYEPIGENKLFLRLDYFIENEKMEINSFEEIIEEQIVKVKQGNIIRRDLLNE